MTTSTSPRPVVLLPPVRQTLWGMPAVLNFACGGLGAGLYVVAALAARFEASPGLRIASVLGPALVLAGFAAVATEAGRPLRGLRVLTRVRTSWMSREVWIGGAFVLLAVAALCLGLLAGSPWPRAAAAVVGVALTVAQGFILREARGIAAWSVRVMPLLFLSSSLVSGVGLYLLVEAASGRTGDSRLLGAVLIVLAVHLVVWRVYVGEARGEATGSRLAVVAGSYLAPTVLVAVALALPAVALAATVAAAVLMIGSQVHGKAALILKAGQVRAVTLPRLRGARHPRGF